jgi:uncharacterized membrane protein
LELSKRDETINQNKESNDKEKENEAVDDGGGKGSEAVDDEEIIKEVKKVKKQNFVTHCLLSAMIVLTVALATIRSFTCLESERGNKSPI